MVEDEEKRIGSAIRAWRTHRRLTQSDLAHACGISSSYLGSLERGQKSGTMRVFLILAEQLDISIVELLAHQEVVISREIEALLKDTPSRLRLPMLRMIREVVLLQVENIRASQRKP